MWTAERFKFNQGIKLNNTSYASGFNYGWLKIKSTWVFARIRKMKRRPNINLEVMIPKLKDFLVEIRGFLIFSLQYFHTFSTEFFQLYFARFSNLSQCPESTNNSNITYISLIWEKLKHEIMACKIRYFVTWSGPESSVLTAFIFHTIGRPSFFIYSTLLKPSSIIANKESSSN